MLVSTRHIRTYIYTGPYVSTCAYVRTNSQYGRIPLQMQSKFGYAKRMCSFRSYRNFSIHTLYTYIHTYIRTYMLLVKMLLLLFPSFPCAHVCMPHTMSELKFDVSRIRYGKLLIPLIRGHLCGRVRRRRFLYAYSSIEGNAKLDLVIAHIILWIDRPTNNKHRPLHALSFANNYHLPRPNSFNRIQQSSRSS